MELEPAGTTHPANAEPAQVKLEAVDTQPSGTFGSLQNRWFTLEASPHPLNPQLLKEGQTRTDARTKDGRYLYIETSAQGLFDPAIRTDQLDLLELPSIGPTLLLAHHFGDTPLAKGPVTARLQALLKLEFNEAHQVLKDLAAGYLLEDQLKEGQALRVDFDGDSDFESSFLPGQGMSRNAGFGLDGQAELRRHNEQQVAQGLGIRD